MRTPRFSVVIPTHNRPVLLERAVDSILKQDFSDFEVIICDNNSTPENREKARGVGVKDKRIHYTYSPVGSLTKARNSGARGARGEIVVFLDDDDRFLPDYLSSVDAFLKGHPDYDIALVGSWHDRGKYKVYERQPISPPWGVFVGNGAALKREIFEKKNLYYDEGLVATEDIIYGFLVARHCKIGLVDKPLMVYERVEGDMNHNQGTNQYQWNEAQFKIAYDKYIREYEAYSNKAGAWLNLALGNLMVSYGHIKEARPYLKRALELQFRLSHLYYYVLSFFPVRVYMGAHHFKLFVSRLISGYYIRNFVKKIFYKW